MATTAFARFSGTSVDRTACCAAVSVANDLVATIGTNATHARQRADQRERDHRPNHANRKSGAKIVHTANSRNLKDTREASVVIGLKSHQNPVFDTQQPSILPCTNYDTPKRWTIQDRFFVGDAVMRRNQ